MRFLTSVDTAEEAERIEQLFDASGVPVFVEADYTVSPEQLTSHQPRPAHPELIAN